MSRGGGAILRMMIALLGFAVASRADSCIQCHSDHKRLLDVTNQDESRAAKAYVDLEKVQKSVHGGQSCTDCHFEFSRYPHPEKTETASCSDCHEDAAAVHATSVHFEAKVTGPNGAQRNVACADCHGVHDILKSSERESRLFPLQVTRTCGACHFDEIDAATATKAELLAQHYCDDTHGTGLISRGLTVAPSCVSCHGKHDTKKRGDPTSRVSRKNVATTCATCHVGILEQYQLSVHNVARENGNDDAPTCTDCHPPHSTETSNVSKPEFRLNSVTRCGECHSHRIDSFQSSRHGKITSLGYGGQVADCADCHGSHDIRPQSDPHSKIHSDHLVETCATCHQGAHEEFVKYKVHAVWDGKSEHNDSFLHLIYIAIHALLVGTMIFGFSHIALWLVRATIAGDWRNRKRGGRTLRRWRPFYVQLHVVFMCSFLLLAGTGMPLHYSTQGWARRLMVRLGGPESAAWVHRVSAVTMLVCIAVYLLHIARRFVVNREKGLFWGPNTMLPRWKDAKDFFGNFRWFFFLGKRPLYDRWAYWEKFDFWAVFWGIMIIGGTGMVLWFPVEATWFLPAWVINVSAIVHGHEALLAVAFIFTFHVFHANLRPDKFPMDPLFLTGRLAEEEMKHDRPLEYERAVREGTLDAMEEQAPIRETVRVAYILGMVVMLLGIALVILMMSAPD